jgi:hypothetical protein
MAKPFPKRLNHVIFLGAGASYTSGYPIGQKLRLMMASKDYFQAELDKLYPTGNSMPDIPLYDTGREQAARTKCASQNSSYGV